jgi:DHA2 family multidrug resistance protein
VSLFMLGNLNLQIGIWNIVWPNVINGFANGFLFVPLTTLTMSTLSNQEMGRGTGLYNLTRNMGASFGVSMVTTLLVRGAQRHQDMLAGRLDPANPSFRQLVAELERYFMLHSGLAPSLQRSYDVLYGMLRQQAMLLSYVDDFRLLAIVTLCCLPFLALFRR